MGAEMGYRGPKWTLECKDQGVSRVTSWRLISSLRTKTQAVNKLLEEKKPQRPFLSAFKQMQHKLSPELSEPKAICRSEAGQPCQTASH